MNAVITAGGRVDDAYAAAAGTAIKALAPLPAGGSMLDRIVDALRGAGVSRIAVVGGDGVRAACGDRVERVIDESPSGSENVIRALHAWSDDATTPLVYATSDMPYVGSRAVADFLQRVPAGAVAMALTEFADFAARFPGAPPFGVNLAGERVVNGGVFSFPAGSATRVAAIATRFFEARKRPWRMATLVSPLTVLRFAFRRLGVRHIEAVGEKALGVRCVAVRRCAPELGFDADTLDEYRYACENP